jgi:flagellar motor protein MotB
VKTAASTERKKEVSKKERKKDNNRRIEIFISYDCGRKN